MIAENRNILRTRKWRQHVSTKIKKNYANFHNATHAKIFNRVNIVQIEKVEGCDILDDITSPYITKVIKELRMPRESRS